MEAEGTGSHSEVHARYFLDFFFSDIVGVTLRRGGFM